MVIVARTEALIAGLARTSAEAGGAYEAAGART